MNIKIDTRKRCIYIDEEPQKVGLRQYELIAYLAENPEYRRSMDQVAEGMKAPCVTTDAIRTAVKRARKVVGDRIRNEHGFGYYWLGQVEIIK